MLNNGLPLKAHQSKEKFEAKKLLKRAAEEEVGVIGFPMRSWCLARLLHVGHQQ